MELLLWPVCMVFVVAASSLVWRCDGLCGQLLALGAAIAAVAVTLALAGWIVGVS